MHNLGTIILLEATLQTIQYGLFRLISEVQHGIIAKEIACSNSLLDRAQLRSD